MARLDSLDAARQALGLQRDILAAQANFYAAYARNLERYRSGDVRENVWARLANPPEPWLGRAIIASTYRTAAQFAALVDIHLATELTLHASRAYLDAGIPFGMFLAAGVLDDQVLQDEGVLQNLTRPLGGSRADLAALDPVQQTYMLLTLASRPWLQQWTEQRPGNLLEQLAAHDLHPVGAQSVPLSVYLDMANAMILDRASDDRNADRSGSAQRRPDDEETGRTVTEMASRLAEISQTQAAALRVSRRNRYLWQHGAAPVNIVVLNKSRYAVYPHGPGRADIRPRAPPDYDAA